MDDGFEAMMAEDKRYGEKTKAVQPIKKRRERDVTRMTLEEILEGENDE